MKLIQRTGQAMLALLLAVAASGALAHEPAFTPAYVPPRLSPPLVDALNKAYRVPDPRPLGYVLEERLMSGMAPIYKAITENDLNFPEPKPGEAPLADPIGPIFGTPLMPPQPDPRDYSRRPILGSGPYTTRLLVYRPADMARFSGTVIVETIHPANGGQMSMFQMLNRFFAARGDIVVGVAHPITLPVLRHVDAQRYATLAVQDYSQIWGQLADVARLFKDGGTDSVVAQTARRVFLTGYSFTALIVTTFAKRHHEVNRMPGGAALFDGYVGGTGDGPMPPLDVPVMLAGNQRSAYPEALLAARREFDADGPLTRRRRYEIPGWHHGPLPVQEPGSAIALPPPEGRERVCGAQWQAGATASPNLVGRPVLEGMFDNMLAWVERGIAPPRAPIIDSDAGKPLLDEHGNVRGGLRLPAVTLPLATFHIGEKACARTGWMLPFDQARLRQLHGSRDQYLRRHDVEVDRLLAQRFITADRATRMKADAAQDTPAF